MCTNIQGPVIAFLSWIMIPITALIITNGLCVFHVTIILIITNITYLPGNHASIIIYLHYVRMNTRNNIYFYSNNIGCRLNQIKFNRNFLIFITMYRLNPKVKLRLRSPFMRYIVLETL